MKKRKKQAMYTAEQLSDRVKSLDAEEQHALFHILTDNADIFNKIFPNVPLISYIVHGGHECSTLGEEYKTWCDHSNHTE